MNNTYKLVATSTFIAFGVILPMAFHTLGAAGPIFLPMHIPILTAGMFLGAREGLLTGLITPGLSSILTGMPPMMPAVPVMTVELGCYGFAAGFLYKNRHMPLLPALVMAMILGRTAAAAAAYVMVLALGIKLKPVFYLTGAVLTGLPGILIQLVFIPVIVKRLQAAFKRSTSYE